MKSEGGRPSPSQCALHAFETKGGAAAPRSNPKTFLWIHRRPHSACASFATTSYTGGIGQLERGTSGDGEAESPFEASVANALRARGHNVALQVGVSGYRIDLAVRHPDMPEHFVLGVECDGAAYHT